MSKADRMTKKKQDENHAEFQQVFDSLGDDPQSEPGSVSVAERAVSASQAAGAPVAGQPAPDVAQTAPNTTPPEQANPTAKK